MTDLATRLTQMRPDTRRHVLSNVVRYYSEERRWDALASILTCPAVLEGMADIGKAFDLAGDCVTVAASLPMVSPKRGLLELMGKAMRQDAVVISQHPELLFQCLWRSCGWHETPDESHLALHDLLVHWLRWKRDSGAAGAWVRSLRPPRIPLEGCDRVILSGHGGTGVTGVRFVESRQVALSTARDGAIRSWNVITGAQEGWQHLSAGALGCLVLSAGDSLAAVTTEDGCIIVLDPATLTLRRRIRSGHVRCIAFFHGAPLIAAACEDEAVRIWNAETGRLSAVLGRALSHPDAVSSKLWMGIPNTGCPTHWGFGDRPPPWHHIYDLVITADDTSVYLGMGDGTVRKWNVPQRRLVASSTAHSLPVRAVATTAADNVVISGCEGSCLGVWDGMDLHLRSEIECDHGLVSALAAIQSSQHIAAGFWDGAIAVLDMNEAGILEEVQGHAARVNDVDVSDDGCRILSGSDDGTACIWSRPLPPCSLRDDHKAAVRTLRLSPDECLLATSSYDHTTRTWDVASGRQLASVPCDGEQVTFSMDGVLCLAGGDQGRIIVFNSRTGEVIGRARARGKVRMLAMSEDNELLCVGAGDTLMLLEMRTGRLYNIGNELLLRFAKVM